MLQAAFIKAKERGAKIISGYISPDEVTTVEYLIEWYQRQGFEVVCNDGKYFIRKLLV